MDDLAERLDLIIALVEGARAMPLSASCVLNRAELLEALEDLRARLPERLADADRILADSEGIIDDAHRQAAAIVADGRREGVRLASGSAVVVQAQSDAASIMAAARQESEDMRNQIDSYVDGKLAGFEELLDRTLTSVTRGRERLASRAAMASAAAAAGPPSQIGPGPGDLTIPRQGEHGGYGPAGHGPAGGGEELGRGDASGLDAGPPRNAAATGIAGRPPEVVLARHDDQWGGDREHDGQWGGDQEHGDRWRDGPGRGDQRHGEHWRGERRGGESAAGGGMAARGGLTGHVRLTSGAGAPIG